MIHISVSRNQQSNLKVHLKYLTEKLSDGRSSAGLEVKSLRPKTYLSPPTVIWFSVPAGHHLCMLCGSADSSDVVWTRQDRRVLVTRQGNSETNQDHRRFLLLQDGSLCLLRLDESNSGEYRCNQELVAELQVLKGTREVEGSGL